MQYKPHHQIEILNFQLWKLLSWLYGPATSRKALASEQHATSKQSVSYFRPRKKAKVSSKVKEGGRRA